MFQCQIANRSNELRGVAKKIRRLTHYISPKVYMIDSNIEGFPLKNSSFLLPILDHLQRGFGSKKNQANYKNC